MHRATSGEAERKGRVRGVKSFVVVSILGRWADPGRKARGGGWKKRSRKSRGVNDFRLVKAQESEERVERAGA